MPSIVPEVGVGLSLPRFHTRTTCGSLPEPPPLIPRDMAKACKIQTLFYSVFVISVKPKSQLL